MKSKKLGKALKLSKSTVANLNNRDLGNLFGGVTGGVETICPTCRTGVCPTTGCNTCYYSCGQQYTCRTTGCPQP